MMAFVATCSCPGAAMRPIHCGSTVRSGGACAAAVTGVPSSAESASNERSGRAGERSGSLGIGKLRIERGKGAAVEHEGRIDASIGGEPNVARSDGLQDARIQQVFGKQHPGGEGMLVVTGAH